jgi:hypothetical protein
MYECMNTFFCAVNLCGGISNKMTIWLIFLFRCWHQDPQGHTHHDRQQVVHVPNVWYNTTPLNWPCDDVLCRCWRQDPQGHSRHDTDHVIVMNIRIRKATHVMMYIITHCTSELTLWLFFFRCIRIRKATHVMTGNKWCIYPMYDYAHCISDALEVCLSISLNTCSHRKNVATAHTAFLMPLRYVWAYLFNTCHSKNVAIKHTDDSYTSFLMPLRYVRAYLLIRVVILSMY